MEDTMAKARSRIIVAKPRIGSNDWTRSVVRVGDGRGFVVEVERRRLVITAGHCLPKLPPAAHGHAMERGTYAKLLGSLGAKPRVWCQCLFVDPVSDLAVLGTPDEQELCDQATGYDALVDAALPLTIGSLRFVRRRKVAAKVAVPAGLRAGRGAIKFGASYWLPPKAESAVWLLSLSGEWFSAQATSTGRWLVVDKSAAITGGMSGSPIVAPDGSAVGVVSTNHSGPLLAANLPGWIVAKTGERMDIVRAAKSTA
jgi:hypothetical protein